MKSVKVSLNSARKPIQQSDELAKIIEQSPATNSLKVEDIYLPLNHLFSAATKRAFQNEVKQLAIQRTLTFQVTTTQTKVVDQVKYFGAMAKGERSIYDAAQKVANMVNYYSDRGFVTGVLTKLVMIKFVTEPHELEKWAIISYIALSPQGLEHLEKNPTKISFPEGGVPSNLEDL